MSLPPLHTTNPLPFEGSKSLVAGVSLCCANVRTTQATHCLAKDATPNESDDEDVQGESGTGDSLHVAEHEEISPFHKVVAMVLGNLLIKGDPIRGECLNARHEEASRSGT